MGWDGCPGITSRSANKLVEFGEAGTMAREGNGVVENFQQKVEQFCDTRLQITWAGVFGEIRPIAVDTDPDFESVGSSF